MHQYKHGEQVRFSADVFCNRQLEASDEVTQNPIQRGDHGFFIRKGTVAKVSMTKALKMKRGDEAPDVTVAVSLTEWVDIHVRVYADQLEKYSV